MLDALVPLGISALIFGGCCSNVYALEAVLKHEPDSGLLITLMQFVLVTLFTYNSQRSLKPPSFLRPTKIPFHKLFLSAAMFYAVNMLNNWAFAFNISVPVHIILRSFGSVTTMAAGWLRGKHYTRLQVVSVLILTLGVMVSAWADAESKGKSLDTSNMEFTGLSFELGLAVLLLAQLLSSFMGIYVQEVYAAHGNHWDENLFYSHFISLPLFLPLSGTLRSQLRRLQHSQPMPIPAAVTDAVPATLQMWLTKLPSSVFMLGLNSTMQLLCITGVNLLGAKSSAVTVTIVLNVRKLVSFILSIWLFGNPLSGKMMVGAALVFGSGALYGWETTVGIKRGRTVDRRLQRQNGSADGLKKEL